MRNSLIERKKTIGSAKFNKRMKSEEFSDVSEEGSYVKTEQNEESLDQQIGWGYFYQSKLEIESIAKEIIPKYKEYRNILFQSIKQICQQGKITKFDYSRLAKDPSEEQIIQVSPRTAIIPLEEKLTTIEKIISQRRIKKYYKNKHEINFQDELDPEDDQAQIYNLYQQAFFKKEVAAQRQPTRNQRASEMIYNEQYLTVPKGGSNAPPTKVVEVESRILEPSNQYNMDVDESFQRMKQEREGPNIVAKKVNYTKVSDPFVGFEHQLSFDVKNQQYFVNDNDQYQIDSFGFVQEDKDEINSQIKYDAQKTKKFKKTNKASEKNDDKYSHTDNLFKNYIAIQNQNLIKQKMMVEKLSVQANKVMNNEIDEQQEAKDSGGNPNEDKVSQLRYILGEIIEVYSVQECLKYDLKFKSYELLNSLYENASIYYEEEIKFQEPLQAKHLSQIIKAAIPQEQDEAIKIVVRNIFGNSESISFQQFLQRLTPAINDKEYQSLDSIQHKRITAKSFELSVRLFDVWIEFDYFDRELRQLLDHNPQVVDRFIEETSESQIFIPQLIAEFIAKSKKVSKSKKMKVEIYFRSILGARLMVSEFFRWIDTKVSTQTKKMTKKQSEEYFYHLY